MDPVVFDVLSDVQGDLDDLTTALDALAGFGPAHALLLNGDLTPAGRDGEYRALTAALAGTRPRVLFAIGNHEFYNGDPNEVSVRRFLEHTAMPAVYSSHEVNGVSVLRLGTVDGSETTGHCVVLGETQLDWLAATLAELPPSAPVLVMSHHALPGTVSGTRDDPRTQAPKIFGHDYSEADRLQAILGAHPNVLLLSGHTHWSLYRDDWLARRVVAGGHPAGFAAVNTGAVQTGFGPDGHGGEQPLDRAENQGLRIEVVGDAVRIHALDFRRRVVIRAVEFGVATRFDPRDVPPPPWPVEPSRG